MTNLLNFIQFDYYMFVYMSFKTLSWNVYPMFYGKISTHLTSDNVKKALEMENALIVNSSLVESLLELRLAEYLSNSSFRQKTNLAKKFKYEFLLWLTGKRDIRSAMSVAINHPSREFMLFYFGKGKSGLNLLMKKLQAKKLPDQLTHDFNPIRLEKISVSRVL